MRQTGSKISGLAAKQHRNLRRLTRVERSRRARRSSVDQRSRRSGDRALAAFASLPPSLVGPGISIGTAQDSCALARCEAH